MFFFTPPVPIAPIECAIVREIPIRTNITGKLVELGMEIRCNSFQSICLYTDYKAIHTNTSCLHKDNRPSL